MKIAVVDDDPRYSNQLLDYIQRFEKTSDEDFQVDTFKSGLEIMFDFKPIYDVFLLDIKMPDMDGMELAQFIRSIDQHAVIMFVTTTPHFAVHGYEVGAFDYLVKPVDYGTFEIVFQSALKKVGRSCEQIMITSEGEDIFLDTSEIIFVEVSDHLISLHTINGTYAFFSSLKDMEKKLGTCHFIKCNKSTLINLSHIIRIQSDVIRVTGNHMIVSSRNKKKAVQKAFMAYYESL